MLEFAITFKADMPPTRIVRLQELQEAGVTQFNIYLMSGEEENTLEIYGRDIIPAIR
jgi:hypothetical protein